MKRAGIRPQTAPATILATTVTMSSSAVGILPPKKIMQAAVARPPMSACPSAPVFQNRIRKAGVTAREMQSRIATLCRRFQRRRLVPTAPLIMVA